jgi:hypothetical protein
MDVVRPIAFWSTRHIDPLRRTQPAKPSSNNSSPSLSRMRNRPSQLAASSSLSTILRRAVFLLPRLLHAQEHKPFAGQLVTAEIEVAES